MPSTPHVAALPRWCRIMSRMTKPLNKRRVIQWATGGVGVAAIQAIAAHPELELVGTWVHSAVEGRSGRR